MSNKLQLKKIYVSTDLQIKNILKHSDGAKDQ